MSEGYQNSDAVRVRGVPHPGSDPLANLQEETRRALRRYASEERRQIAELLQILAAKPGASATS